MKTVGIIGGMGPDTTAEFYLGLISQCLKINKINRPPILIYNIPLPYKVEEDALIRGVGENRYLPLLIDAAQKLEKAGADFLVMPCNTLHVFIEDIRRSVKIPMLSIAEETVKFLKGKKISDVGVLSTKITLKKKIYENYFLQNNIKQILPDERQQKVLGGIIYKVVMNKHDDIEEKELAKIITTFREKGVINVILACTDLQLLKPKHAEIKIYDTMKILAAATVQEILRD